MGAEELAEKLKTSCADTLSVTAYGKYKGQLDVFAKRMEGYSHRLNVKY